MRHGEPLRHLGRVRTRLGVDLGWFLGTSLRSRIALAAENLFLRKQVALYRERQGKPHRASDATRRGLVLLARWFAWRAALTIVQPATFLRWHRGAFRLLWRGRSRSGRPRSSGGPPHAAVAKWPAFFHATRMSGLTGQVSLNPSP